MGVEALAALTGTPDEIAATLASRGIRGEIGSPCRCPIAIAVGADAIWTRPPAAIFGLVKVPLPAAVVEFVELFDDGWYPELVEGD